MVKLENNQEIAAAKTGMDRKTARKYLRARRLPSELPQAPLWRTREDAFEQVWEDLSAVEGQPRFSRNSTIRAASVRPTSYT